MLVFLLYSDLLQGQYRYEVEISKMNMFCVSHSLMVCFVFLTQLFMHEYSTITESMNAITARLHCGTLDIAINIFELVKCIDSVEWSERNMLSNISNLRTF